MIAVLHKLHACNKLRLGALTLPDVLKQAIEISIQNGSCLTTIKRNSFDVLFYFYIWVFFKRLDRFDVPQIA